MTGGVGQSAVTMTTAPNGAALETEQPVQPRRG